MLSEPGDDTAHVYFPDAGLVSVIAMVSAKKGLEVGLVGRQGMVGVSLALGEKRSPARALVQAAGRALRVDASAFSAEMKRNAALRQAALRYAHVSMATAMQIAACNNVHVVGERCARWLLMTADLLSTRGFFLTQDLLAQMLGVRRGAVSAAAGELQERGLVTYSRGNMTILDRHGLVEAACSCYRTISAL